MTVGFFERAEDGVLLAAEEAEGLLLLSHTHEHVVGGVSGGHDEIGQARATGPQDLGLDDDRRGRVLLLAPGEPALTLQEGSEIAGQLLGVRARHDCSGWVSTSSNQ